MRCKICDRDRPDSCLCGYCLGCIKSFGHDNCAKMLKEKNESN